MNSDTAACRVLVVEDEAMVAMLLEAMLEDLGHTVVGIAAKMDDAVRLIADVQADIAILDVNLQSSETYPLAETLKSRGIPFIFATGYGSSGLRAEWRQTPTLQKPFQMSDLNRLIGELLRSRTA